MSENKSNKALEFIKNNLKQVIVATVILIFAIVLLVIGLSGLFSKKQVIKQEVVKEKVETVVEEVKKPTNVVVNFTATTENPITYEIFYTTEREVWFDGSHTLSVEGKEGQYTYAIDLPLEKIYRFRLDFGSNPGKVTIKDIYLSGTQEYDLNNFDLYEFKNINNVEKDKDGNVTFTSDNEDPYMAYRPALIR